MHGKWTSFSEDWRITDVNNDVNISPRLTTLWVQCFGLKPAFKSNFRFSNATWQLGCTEVGQRGHCIRWNILRVWVFCWQRWQLCNILYGGVRSLCLKPFEKRTVLQEKNKNKFNVCARIVLLRREPRQTDPWQTILWETMTGNARCNRPVSDMVSFIYVTTWDKN